MWHSSVRTTTTLPELAHPLATAEDLRGGTLADEAAVSIEQWSGGFSLPCLQASRVRSHRSADGSRPNWPRGHRPFWARGPSLCLTALRGRHPAGIGERLSATAAIGVVDD